MGKIIVLSIRDDEEKIFECIQDFLISKANSSLVQADTSVTVLSFPGLDIDLYNHNVVANGRQINLTDLEFRLLLYLAKQPGRVYTYQQIYEEVWGEEYACEKGNIMSHIRHIREKIESDNEGRKYIENIRNVGYRFNKQ